MPRRRIPCFSAAVARRLRELNVEEIILADSSGGMYTERNLRKMLRSLRLFHAVRRAYAQPRYHLEEEERISNFNAAIEADYIINCAKLKTHALMVMTAAVKNMFGSIPGIKKAEYHCTKATIEPFTKMLLDLHETVKPHLNLVDAIDCMEGNGPSGGKIRHMGVYAGVEMRVRCRTRSAPSLCTSIPRSSVPFTGREKGGWSILRPFKNKETGLCRRIRRLNCPFRSSGGSAHYPWEASGVFSGAEHPQGRS